MEDGDPTIFGFDFVLSYELNAFRLFVPVGVGVVLPDGGDTLLAWNFSPYIVKDLNGPYFYAGLQLFNGGRPGATGPFTVSSSAFEERINISVPMGIRWDF
jgi:hypothetical protein